MASLHETDPIVTLESVMNREMRGEAWSVDQTVVPFVDGVLCSSESEATSVVINPSTGQRFISIPAGCSADVEKAVASARRAYDDGRWSEASPSIRKRALHRLADLIEREGGRLDALDAAEMGKPVREVRANAISAAEFMRFSAESVDKIMGDVYVSDKNSFVVQRRVPRGVVAAIVPWNFPTFNAVLKIAPALAAGNSVVLKPSELSSRSAIRLADLAVQAGLPTGVLNVVPGLGETVGQSLGLHRDVDMITFTGSTEVGKRMLQLAGQSNMKLIMAECGGKSPHIVFDDGVDPGVAGDAVAQLLLVNQGQLCSVGSRLLVQRSIESAVVERITERTKNIVMGDATDPQTTFGPIVSEKQCARVMEYIETAQDEGAELAAGGRRVLQQSGGFFVEPTVFRNVSPRARIAQEEIFGPVLSVISFRDVAEAIEIANSTMYGLIAYAWTSSLTTSMKLAKGIRSSVVVNSAPAQGDGPGHALAFEPAGQSGIGTEGGLAGMESYLRRQVVWINHG